MLKKIIIMIAILWSQCMGAVCLGEGMMQPEQTAPLGGQFYVTDGSAVQYTVLEGSARVMPMNQGGGIYFDHPGMVVVQVTCYIEDLETLMDFVYPIQVIPMEQYNQSSGQGTMEGSWAAPIQALELEPNFADQILHLVNAERAKVGAGPLRIAGDLEAAAMLRARELTVKFSHERPNGKDCDTAVRDKGRGIGENIAAGHPTAKQVMESWMKSSGHRRNILDPLYREIGIGAALKKDDPNQWGIYWVQLFRR